MKQKPVISEDARKYMVRGKAAFKGAKETNDFNATAGEFQKALLAAPWFAERYYNLGIMQDKAGQHNEAAQSLKLYLVAAPNAPDAKKVKELIYEIECRQEKASKENAAIQAAEEYKRQGIAALERLRGTWYSYACWVGSDVFGGCTDAEARCSNWHWANNDDDSPKTYNFTFPGDGTVSIDTFGTGMAKCSVVWGVAQWLFLGGIRWENRDDKGMPKRQVFATFSASQDRLTISCDRPLSGANSSASYHYGLHVRNP